MIENRGIGRAAWKRIPHIRNTSAPPSGRAFNEERRKERVSAKSRDAQEIPLGARIIFACDSYHAMTTDHRYRTGMSHDDALAELRRHSGTSSTRV